MSSFENVAKTAIVSVSAVVATSVVVRGCESTDKTDAEMKLKMAELGYEQKPVPYGAGSMTSVWVRREVPE